MAALHQAGQPGLIDPFRRGRSTYNLVGIKEESGEQGWSVASWDPPPRLPTEAAGPAAILRRPLRQWRFSGLGQA